MFQLNRAILLIAAIALVDGSSAQGADARPASSPVIAMQTTSGGLVIPPDDYRGPDGAYGSSADMVRSIQGTPCGQACQAASFLRWNRPAGRG